MKRIPTITIAIVVLLTFVVVKKQFTTEAVAFQDKEEAIYYQYNPYLRWGKASWYSKNSPGVRKHTANEEVFNDRALTCAMWGVPFNQKVKVTNLENGQSVVLRVNDRGPHGRYVRQGRIIDMTEAAFKKIDATQKGLVYVSVEFL